MKRSYGPLLAPAPSDPAFHHYVDVWMHSRTIQRDGVPVREFCASVSDVIDLRGPSQGTGPSVLLSNGITLWSGQFTVRYKGVMK